MFFPCFSRLLVKNYEYFIVFHLVQGSRRLVLATYSSDDTLSYVTTRARIAIYDDLLSAPRIIEIEPAPTADFIEHIASTTYDKAHEHGSRLPYSAIREIAENFIHASFKECTVSVLNGGNTISFTDQGPGIEKKQLVQQPGVTSASGEMKRYIRGVGSGFPLVKEYLQHAQGTLSITDNALEGTVVTLSVYPESLPGEDASLFGEHAQATPAPLLTLPKSPVSLDARDVKTLWLLYEKEALGPSDLAGPLSISVATAYRLLEKLEHMGFVEQSIKRKRILSNAGLAHLQSLDR
jgi:hypothetical protein